MPGLPFQLPIPDSIQEILVGLFLGLLLSLILAWHFVKYGKTLSNRRNFAWIFPLITLTTVLVISIVKSSLTLSLGLVGALSIVRFRTPVKEPEELAYLFLAIAIGIGLGAAQIPITIIAALVILIFMAIRSAALQKRCDSMFFLTIEIPTQKDKTLLFATIKDTIAKLNISADLRRMDAHEAMIITTYYVNCTSQDDVIRLMNELRQHIPEANISFVRQDNLIGL